MMDNFLVIRQTDKRLLVRDLDHHSPSLDELGEGDVGDF